MSLRLKRVRGSSIIEVVIGIFIISLSIALTGVLFAGVFDSSSRIKRQRAWFHLNQWGNEVLLTSNVVNEEVEFPSFKIVKESILMDEDKNLWTVRMKAVEDNGDIISQRRFLVVASESE